jgi:hypothetical protein
LLKNGEQLSVPQQIAGDAEDPCRKIGFGFEQIPHPISTEEHLLGGVFCDGIVREQALKELEEGRLVVLHQMGEGFERTLTELFGEQCVHVRVAARTGE